MLALIGTNFRERFLLEMRHSVKPASTRRPRLEVPDDVAQESDFWKFVGTVAIPAAGVALLAFAIGFVPRVVFHLDHTFLAQSSHGGTPVLAILREWLQVVRQGSLSREPTNTEASPTEHAPVEPFSVEPPFEVPTELPPPLTVERDEPPGRIEPAPLPADRAEWVPPKLEGSELATDPSDLPRELAAVPRSVPSTPEPLTPGPPTPEPSAEAQSAELPASPEPTLPAPVETRPRPEQPVSPQSEPPLEVEGEPPPVEAAPEPSPAGLRARKRRQS